jgi:tetratricopeptide (TPR) repeat protein
MTRTQKQAVLVSLMALIVGAGACARTPIQKRDRFLDSGKRLFEKKEYARAILEFRNAVAAMPKDAESYYQLGRAYNKSREYQTAANMLQKALQLDPNHAGAQLEFSKILAGTMDQENLQSAESRLAALLQGGHQDPEALNTLALTELKLGKLDSAVSNLEHSILLAPNNLSSVVLLIQAKIGQKDYIAAEEILKKACADSPQSGDARAILGTFYISRGRQAEAEQEFQKAISLDPKQASSLLELGRIQARSGRKKEADETFKRLASLPDPATKPAHALFLLEEGRSEEAIRELEQLAKTDPNDRPARTRLVEAYWSFGHKPDAERLLQSVLKKNPKDAEALLQRGELYLLDGKYDNAERDLNQVLHEKPNSANVHYILSKLNQARGSSLLQRQELTEALRLDPMVLQIRLELAQFLLAHNGAKTALEVLNEAPEFQRQAVPTIVQRNWVLWAMAEFGELRKGIDQGLSKGRVPDLLIQDGLLRLRQGDAKAARAALEEALRMDPTDLRALNSLRLSYVAQKQSAEAVKRVKEYAASQPHSAEVQGFLGIVLMSGGDRKEARVAFEAAKAANPRYERAELSLVQMDAVEAKWDDAANRLKAIVSSNEGNVLARFWLAEVQTVKGNNTAAIENFRKVIDAAPDHAQALNNMAYLMADKKPDEALKYAERAAEMAPTDPDYADTLGWILYQKGMYPSAIKYLERAATKKGNVVWKYHLAMAYAKAGDAKRANATLQVALKDDPNTQEAKAAIEVVRPVK